MSELTKSFEQDFPLPFHIEEDETGQLRTLCPASGTAFMDFGIVEGPLDFDGYDVQEYLVKCANLMPEAVELLGKCAIEMQKRCDYCAGKDGRACIGCSNSEMRTEIHALLAQLEGDVKNA